VSRCQRVAHRGASLECPENTLPAFRRALELGADAIELDVHATRDGIVVVHHDPVPCGISSDPALAGRPIAELTWVELSTFEVQPTVRIPSLGDVLTLVGERAVVYVELKGGAIEESVIATVRAGRASCALHSFDHDAILRASRIAPEIPRGLLFDEYVDDPAGAMRRCGARDIWPHWSLVDTRLVDRVHEVGGSVIAWTVNDASAAATLRQLGVDGLCSDDVRILGGE
jgi:glycerophosphoryl diester phosphodiesterase